MKEKPERRVENRRGQPATVLIETSSETFDKSTPAHVIKGRNLDLSPNGIKVEVDEAIPLGSILQLCISLHPEDQSLSMVGEVKWIEPFKHFYRIGFELYDAETTDIDEWQKMIKELINHH